MKDENNELRLVAAQIIYDLWKSGDIGQLKLLRDQAEASIEFLRSEKESETLETEIF